MLVIGVAGGIASGKTTVAKLYESFGSTVLDADAIGHEILETEDMRNTLVQAFGNQITGAAGVVDRRALGRVVFGDRLARKKLNQLIRPPIRATIRQRIQRMREESKTDVVVVDAPLLVDTGPTDLADCVILVTAPESTRKERITLRDGLSPHEADQRITAQVSDVRQARWADYILENDGTQDELARKAEGLWNHILDAR